jgi:prophage regulatory protein
MTTRRKIGTDLPPPALGARMLRSPQVVAKVGLSKATIRRLMRLDLFPVPTKVGLRAIAWRLCDIEAYLAARPKATNLASYPSKLQEAADPDRQGG